VEGKRERGKQFRQERGSEVFMSSGEGVRVRCGGSG